MTHHVIDIVDIAAELGVTREQIATTVVGRSFNARHEGDTWYVRPEIAEYIKTIYRNAAKEVVQEPSPTPWSKREGFDEPAYTEGRDRTLTHPLYRTSNA